LFCRDGNKPPVCKVLIGDSSLCYRNKDRRADETTDCSGASQKLARRRQREPRLSVLRVPECGWSDLGTPRSVAACLGRLAEDSWHSDLARDAGLVSLAAAIWPAAQLRIA
jgi:hypothetical protein